MRASSETNTTSSVQRWRHGLGRNSFLNPIKSVEHWTLMKSLSDLTFLYMDPKLLLNLRIKSGITMGLV